MNYSNWRKGEVLSVMVMLVCFIYPGVAKAFNIAGNNHGASAGVGVGGVNARAGLRGQKGVSAGVGTGGRFAHTFYAGPVDVTPAIGVGINYDDNFFAGENTQKKTLITTLSPELGLSIEKPTTKYQLLYRATKGIISSSRQDDYLDHHILSGADFLLSKLLDASLQADYHREHDGRGTTFTGLGFTGSSPDKYREYDLNLTFGYGHHNRIEIYGEYSNKRYYTNLYNVISPAVIIPLTATRDFDTIGTGIGFSWLVGPKTKAVIEARYRRFDYKLLTFAFNQDSTEQKYFVGADWEATAKTSGRFRIGYTTKRFNDKRNSGSSTLGVELGVTWKPRTYSIFDLSVENTPVETDGTGSVIRRTSSFLNWTHQWSGRFSHQANLGYAREKFIGLGTNRRDNIYSAGAGISYQLFSWLNVGPSYEYNYRSSNVANASFHGNTYGINFSGTL